jgi:hypothetical protein
VRVANPVGPGLQQGPGLNGVPSRQGVDANWNKRYWVGSAYNRNGVGVRLPGVEVAANYASSPDHASLNITGDIDIRVRTAYKWNAPGPVATAIHNLVAKMSTSSAAGYRFSASTTVGTKGCLNFIVRVGGAWIGAFSTEVPYFPDNTFGWVRVTRESATGTYRFYTSTDGSTWTQLGADVAGTAGAITNNNLPLRIGADGDTNTGSPQIISNVSIWNGIEGSGGVNVFNADFAAQATGTTSFVEANGRTVTITSAAQAWPAAGAASGVWAESSGGVGGASTPTNSSEVWVDAASGPVTIVWTPGVNILAGAFDTSQAVTGAALSTGNSATFAVGGGVVPDPRFIIGPNFDWQYSGGGSMVVGFYGTGPWTGRISIRSGELFTASEIRAGSWRMDSDWVGGVAGSGFDLYAGGKLDTNGYTLGSRDRPWLMRLWQGGTAPRWLVLGSSTVWCSSWTANVAGLDIDPGTSTINVVGGTSALGGTFSGYGGQRYNNVVFSPVQSNVGTVAGMSHSGGGSASIAHLTVRALSTNTYYGSTANYLPEWNAGTNSSQWAITNLTMEGPPNYSLLVHGVGWGSAGMLYSANPPTLSNVTFTDITAGGASIPWSGTRLGDGGNNSNITFPVSQTNYWVESTPGLTGTGLYCGTTNGSGSAGGSSRGIYASAADSAALSITGDIDLRAKFSGRITRETSGTQFFICKANTPGVPSRSYKLGITYLGVPVVFHSTNGTSEFSASATEAAWPISAYTAWWLRATRVASTGVVTFYTSTDGSTWTQLGNAVTGTAGAIYDSTVPLWMGAGEGGATSGTAFDGTLLRAQIYDGIAGTLAFDADFETAPAAALSFTESSVNAATVTVVPFAATSNGAHSDAAHWAISSGGASGTGRVPLAHDDVVYDGNSGTGRPQWDTNDVGRNVTGTGATVGIIDLFPRYIVGGATTQTRIFGSLTVGNLTGVTWTTGASSLEFCGRGATFTHSIGSAFGWGDSSTSIVSYMRFYPLPSTTHALGSDLNTTWGIQQPTLLSTGGGTFDADIYNVTAYLFTDALTTQVRTVDFGSGTWTLTGISGTVLGIPNQANLTLAGNPSWVISESLDAVVKDGKWRVPQYGSDPSNTTRATSYVTADATNGSNAWATPRPATALTDDLDIIVRFNRDFTTQIAPLLHTWNLIPTPGISFVSYVSATNFPVLQMSSNGISAASTATCTAPLPFGGGATGWLRITRTKATGEVKFYTCADQVPVPSGGDWVQLGATVITLFTSTLYAGKADLAVGQSVGASALPRGLSIYHAQVSNVIGGTPVAVLDFTALPDYSLSTTDAQGNVWRSYQYASRTTRRVVGGAAVGYATVTGNVWGMPDSAALSITSAIDIQVRARGDAWTTGSGVLVAKYAGAGGRSYNFQQGGANGLLLTLSQDGSNQLQVTSGGSLGLVGIQNGQTIWLRATWRASDGRVQFFFAPDSASPPGSWTQIGTDKNIAYASLYDGTAPLEIGVSNVGLTSPFVSGDFRRVRIFNGIEGSGGTLAFDADFTTLQDDTYAFRESANNLVVFASADGSSSFPSGRTTKSLSVNNKTLPGSSLTVQGGGSLPIYLSGTGNSASLHGFPALVCVGGRWLWATDSTGGSSVFPSITWTTSPTGPRNAFVRRTAQCKWSSGGTVTVNYADVLYNDADGASIPFSNVNGFLFGTTDWIDENIYPDYIILGMQNP